MRYVFLILFASFIALSCTRDDNAQLNVTINNAPNKQIVLSKLQMNKVNVVDTITTDASGNFKYTIAINSGTPDFYYLSYNRKRLASLIVKGGDKIDVKVDTLGSNLSVEGSQESLSLIEIEREVYDNVRKFDSLSVALADAVDKKQDKVADQLQQEVSKLYVSYKRSAIKRIMTNPASFANISLLYQRLAPSLPLFSDPMDVVYFQRVKDTLSLNYPNSLYVISLDNAIEEFNKALLLQDKIDKVSEVPFPELVLPDLNSKPVMLSSMLGKPFILLFWTATNPQQKIFNQELKELYQRYNKSKGLNIYQVSVDVDKTMWASVVKDQELPWTNVCDGKGRQSPAVSTYNIEQIPTMFIVNSKGEIVAKNVFDKSKLNGELSKIN